MSLFKIILLYIYLESNNHCRRLFDCLLRTSGSSFSNIWKSKNLQFQSFFWNCGNSGTSSSGFFCKIFRNKEPLVLAFWKPLKELVFISQSNWQYYRRVFDLFLFFGELQYNISELILEFLRTSHMWETSSLIFENRSYILKNRTKNQQL